MNSPKKQSVWESKKYYAVARQASLDIKHPGMKLLLKLAQGKTKILDLGCGEGTRLSLIAKSGTGIDISKTAIAAARKKYSKLKFVVGDLEDLPFEDESFEVVFSAFVFEHLSNPEKVLLEAKRVLVKNGEIIIMAPNYGSPNRSSPPFIGSRIKKISVGFVRDLLWLIIPPGKLDWHNVKPIATPSKYESDWDVTIEPYLLSIKLYLERIGFRVTNILSTWSYELPNAKIHQKIIRLLGEMGIYPFNYWQPHITIHATKI